MSETGAQGNGSPPRSARHLLKVLSGPQLGAEAKLLDGEHLLGSSDECDLVLSDASVAPHHARLLVRNGTVSVEAEDSGVTIDGRALEAGQDVELPSETVIGVGTTNVGIGTSDTDWSTLMLAASAAAGTNGRPAPSAAPQSDLAGAEGTATGDEAPDQTAAASPEIAEETQTRPGSVADEEADDLQPADTGDSAAGRGRRLAWTAASLIAVALISLVAMRLVETRAGRGDEATAEAAAAERSLFEAKRVIAMSGVPDIDASLGASGSVVVEGYIQSDAEKQKITDALSAADVEADNLIWPIDAMMSDVRDVLDRVGGDSIALSHVGQGTVALDGYYSGALSADEISALVRDEVPAVRGIESTVRTLAEAVADLRTRLRRADLDDYLNVASDGARVEVGGVLGPDQMTAWLSVLDDFRTAMDGSPPHVESVVKAQKLSGAQIGAQSASIGVGSTLPPSDFPSLVIRGVIRWNGGEFYALLGNGLRIGKGDTFDGASVEEVGPKRVVLRVGDQQHIYNVGEDYE